MAPKSFRIVVLHGDGIGPEVVDQAVKVLQTISASSEEFDLKLENHLFGGCAIDETGEALPASTLTACKEADAILMGSIGGPKWGVDAKVRPESGLLQLRKELGVYANIRPANFASDSLLVNTPLKPHIAKGVNIIVIRELIGGIYFGKRKEQGVAPNEDVAWDTMPYSVHEVQRITRVAAQIALVANPPLEIHSIDKANVLASSRLWRRVVTETIQKEFPQLKLDHHLVDSAAMVMVANPKKLNGVVLTENLFGDILSDQSSIIPGSLGLLPSASLANAPALPSSPNFKPVSGLYEPIHGSAPDIAGQGIANPVGTILSAAMLLRYSLGLDKQAKAVEDAVRKVLDDTNIGGHGLRTKDLGGSATTNEMGEKIVETLKTLLMFPLWLTMFHLKACIQVFGLVALGLVRGQLHPAEPAKYPRLPSLREQADIQDRWKEERIQGIPALLAKYNVDGWLMSQREHAEDPIWWSIKNATDFDCHRRTIILFHNKSVLPDLPNPMKWVDNTGAAWPELVSTLEALDMRRIAVNIDSDINFASGMHVGELDALGSSVHERWMNRMVNVPMLAVEYVATRADGMLKHYRDLQEMVWAMLEEGFSSKVIQPNVTSTVDLQWWFREKMLEQNVTTWNHPRVSVIVPESFPGWEGTDDVIQEGDLLHIDFGITAMGLNTDTQHMAYVLRTSQGETEVPAGLKAGLKKGNRMQDIVLEQMRPGLTGNEVLSRSLEQMEREEIEGQIFCHPIGDWGHDAGAVIGFTNLPDHVPILGDLPILPNTYYSIELYAYHFVPERRETLRFRLEENAYWDEEARGWLLVRGRQEHMHVVDRSKKPEQTQSTEFRVQLT
ncbi:hypothetical protein ONZ45_g7222 [Pleurotus djamor]|nr:hypothetical protein ONZ45_g7222 [Pleurotus djamor]